MNKPQDFDAEIAQSPQEVCAGGLFWTAFLPARLGQFREHEEAQVNPVIILGRKTLTHDRVHRAVPGGAAYLQGP